MNGRKFSKRMVVKRRYFVAVRHLRKVIFWDSKNWTLITNVCNCAIIKILLFLL